VAVLPALWVGLEWLRTSLFGGFPWNLAAYAWVDVPGALPLAAWIGAYGVSFLVLFVAAAVASAVETRRVAPVLVGALVPLLLLPLAARASWRAAVAHETDPAHVLSGRPVRLLQPNIRNQVGFDEAEAMAGYRRLLAMSRDACEPGALVVWPESAAWPFVYGRAPLLDADLAELNRRGCAVLLNSVYPAGDSYFNSAFLLAPGRPDERYDKRRLVPFGEYVPFAGVFSWVDKLARNAGDYRPAEGLRLLAWGADRLGLSICYEVIFPADVAQAVRRGATILATITNDAWYGDTSAPWQHLRAARFRAAESRRPMLRAAITGVSAVIRPDGSVARQIGVFEQGTISARISGLSGLTPYTRAPWLVPAISSALAAFGVLFASRRSRR
jgi:apolipoprotein N-acyltransferase